jgi:beta-mannosidase
MIAANINTLRICGIGSYESDEFYRLADENGILIWHDVMLSTAYYPVNQQFIDNIRREIIEQVSIIQI